MYLKTIDQSRQIMWTVMWILFHGWTFCCR